MRKANVLLGIAAVFFLLFGSCISENEANAQTDKVLLKKLEGDVMASHSEYNFYYDGQKLSKVVFELGIASSEMTSIKGYDNYFYTNELITEIRTYNETDRNTVKRVFTYDASQRLLQEVVLNLENGRGQKNVYTYNGNGSVEVQHFYGDLNSQSTYADSDMFYLENGEIAQYDYHLGETVYGLEFEYDQGNNPMKNVTGMDKIKLCRYESSGWYGIAKNMKKITYLSSGEPNDSVEFEIFYNEENYPIAANSTPNSPGPFNYRYEYYQQ